MARVLLTASGAQGTIEVCRSFQCGGHYVHGVDLNPNCIGKFVCDAFTVVPPADTPEYIEKLQEIVEDYDIDIIFPQSDLDVLPLSANKDKLGCKVVISSQEALEIATDKGKTYDSLNSTGCIPNYGSCNAVDVFIMCAHVLGYKVGKKMVCRPMHGKGGRGIFILRDGKNELGTRTSPPMFNLETAAYMGLPDTEYLMTEFVEGEEIDSMALCEDGEVYLITHKTRAKELAGTIVEGKVVNRPDLDKSVRDILRQIPLSYNISIQFKGGKLIEINPRSSTYIYGKSFSEPLLALELCNGDITPDDICEKSKYIPYGKSMIRYMKQKQW